MGSANVQKIHRVQGKLSWNPSNLATAYPHGGTALGVVHSVALVPAERTFDVRSEELGGEIVESVYLGKDWAVSALVRQYDTDALSRLFPSVSAGSSTGEALVAEPGGSIGGRLSSRAGVLLFTPDDSTKPGFIAYRALPQVDATARFSFAIVRELGFLMAFRCIRDASARILKIGRLADLSL